MPLLRRPAKHSRCLAGAFDPGPVKEDQDHDHCTNIAGGGVSTPEVVRAARAALASRLHDLRTLQGWTQADVALRMNFGRSTVARAERSGECSRDFLAHADALYGTENNELAQAHDRIEALRAGAQAQDTRRARAAGRGLTTAQVEATAVYTALDAACPHCRTPVAVVLEQTAALVTVETVTRR